MQMLLVIQVAELRADHDWNLAEMHIGKETLTHLLGSAFRIINKGRGDTNIYEER